ncbi:hypothetical protein D9M68_736950 [compost metagenome]
MLDGGDVIRDFADLDADAVFVRPLLHDALVGGITPRHPAGENRPAQLEGFRLGVDGKRLYEKQGQHAGGGKAGEQEG